MAAGQARGDASVIRAVSPADHDAIWTILEPVIRAGETLAIPRDMTRQAALSLWLSSDRTVRVLEEDGELAEPAIGDENLDDLALAKDPIHGPIEPDDVRQLTRCIDHVLEALAS